MTHTDGSVIRCYVICDVHGSQPRTAAILLDARGRDVQATVTARARLAALHPKLLPGRPEPHVARPAQGIGLGYRSAFRSSKHGDWRHTGYSSIVSDDRFILRCPDPACHRGAVGMSRQEVTDLLDVMRAASLTSIDLASLRRAQHRTAA